MKTNIIRNKNKGHPGIINPNKETIFATRGVQGTSLKGKYAGQHKNS